MDKPWSPACERNRDPILAVLRERFADRRRVLEIGSGTGQHAVHFAAALPHLIWQASDVAANLPGIRLWLDEAALPNTPAPLAFDVDEALPDVDEALRDALASSAPAPASTSALPSTPTPAPQAGRAQLRVGFDAVFTANTLHIMSWPQVERLFAALPRLTGPGALLAVYGPFNYGGRFTSPSNAAFDAALRRDAPHRGIRDIEAVDALAQAAGFALLEDRPMPANNRCIVWQRDRT